MVEIMESKLSFVYRIYFSSCEQLDGIERVCPESCP